MPPPLYGQQDVVYGAVTGRKRVNEPTRMNAWKTWSPLWLALVLTLALGSVASGQATEYGEPVFDVTTSVRRLQTQSELEAELSFGAPVTSILFAFGGVAEYALISMALQDMDLEVGERTNLFGFSPSWTRRPSRGAEALS